jgi:ACR3 family arsenite efflux pump ArsB
MPAQGIGLSASQKAPADQKTFAFIRPAAVRGFCCTAVVMFIEIGVSVDERTWDVYFCCTAVVMFIEILLLR